MAITFSDIKKKEMFILRGSEFVIKAIACVGQAIHIEELKIEDKAIKRFIEANYRPDAVFSEEALERWAEGNGYILSEEGE